MFFKETSLNIFELKKINKIEIINNNYLPSSYVKSKINVKVGQNFWSFNPIELEKKLSALQELHDAGLIATEIKMIVEQMIELYQNELENISPVNICDKINCKVFLMHGGNDSMVPYIESINLSENLKNSQLFISGLYEHREIQKLVDELCRKDLN